VTVSQRAEAYASPTHLMQAHVAVAADPWSPDNPGGYVNLAVAENRLLFDLLEPKLNGRRNVTAADTAYQVAQGMPSFRAELARFLSRQRGVDVDPEHLVVLGGGNSALEALAYALCDPGDGIVVPTPYWSGLDEDVAGRAGAVVVPAERSSADGFALTAEVVERAIVRAREHGQVLRAVALLSPDNPTGVVYDAPTLRAVAEVVHGHGLQLVVDEVFAGSVYDSTFVSAATVDVVPPQRLHLVWGFAKDFGLGGFKAGVLHSTDPDVLAVARRFAFLSPVSSDTQVLLRDLLADDEFTARLDRERVARLGDAYARTTKVLAEHGVGFVPAGAGLFVWADLRPWLVEPTFEGETRLWQRLLDEARVLVVPGAEFHCGEPGWFRVCFAAAPDMVGSGLERLVRALALG